MLCPSAIAQRLDDAPQRHRHERHAGYDFSGHQTRRMIFGNSTLFGAGFTFSKFNLVNAELGRSLVNTSEMAYYTRTIGCGYMHQFRDPAVGYYKLFYDYAETFLIAGITGRIEMLANERFDRLYARQSFGLHYGPSPYIHLEVLYAYGFLLNGSDNQLRGGLTIGVKAIGMKQSKRRNYW